MDITLTERLELVPAPVQFIELLTAGKYERAGRLINASVPHGWPHDEDASAGLRAHLRAMQEDRRELPWRVRLIVLRESREVIGSVNMKGPPGQSGEVEIGWGVVAEHRGRGVAVEAARAVVEWAFRQECVERVIATIPEDNGASAGVAKRLGMRRTEERKRNLPVWALRRVVPSSSAGRG